MAKKNNTKQNAPRMPRDKRIAFMLTDEELSAMNRYLEKYKIKNRSRWFRETLLSHIFRVYEDDYPTLFSENEMRR